jgi:hypothetical protein
MTPFQSLREYERFIYTLQQRFPSILRSTLVVAQRGRLFAELTGEIAFADGYRLVVYERLSWDNGPLALEGYSYEAWCGTDKLYGYDSQPHPDDSALADTDPHHKHIPPDIKHHRIPTPDLSFSHPNLPFLIEEIENTRDNI